MGTALGIFLCGVVVLVTIIHPTIAPRCFAGDPDHIHTGFGIIIATIQIGPPCPIVEALLADRYHAKATQVKGLAIRFDKIWTTLAIDAAIRVIKGTTAIQSRQFRIGNTLGC